MTPERKVELRGISARHINVKYLNEALDALDEAEQEAEMSDGCLVMVADTLTAMGCCHKDPAHTPPMMYPEWIMCCLKHRTKELTAERDRLKALVKEFIVTVRPLASAQGATATLAWLDGIGVE
jgi:hypothetical protein